MRKPPELTSDEAMYFDYLLEMVDDFKTDIVTKHIPLLLYLHSREFTWKIPLDENRAIGGKDLRKHFIKSDYIPDCKLDPSAPCSILEMMVAFAHRLEIEFMTDAGRDDMTYQWFWDFIDSMGLMDFEYDDIDYDEIDDILDRFLERRYYPDGEGSLFTIKDTNQDLRKVEIWYQAQMYMNYISQDM